MIKTVVIPQNNLLHLAIPNNYIGKEIEILLYSKDEFETLPIENGSQIEDFLKDNKFEAVKYRHEDQSRLSQTMSQLDIKIFFSFVALQLAFAGFTSQFRIDDTITKLCLIGIDLVFAALAWKLIYNNYRRRKEVVETIVNCNTALRYDVADVYLKGKKLNSDTIHRSWYKWFAAGIAATVIGLALILFLARLHSL